MSQYQRLLLIINPVLRHSHAILHAAALAKASGASLHIAALLQSLDILLLLEQGVRDKVRESYLKEYGEWLEEQVRSMRRRGINVTTEVAWVDDVQLETLQYVTELQPDLLIKEIRHEPVLTRAFFTPMDWHLLRHCSVPIYLLGASGDVLPRKVVAAVDSSSTQSQNDELNERIIKQASSLALQCNAELHLLSACDITADFLGDMGDGIALSDLTKQLRRKRQKSFLKLAGRFGVPSDCRHFIKGHPVPTITEFANENQVDVIVMGRTQSHGLGKLIGSTTEHILYQVPCSVLAV